MNDDDTRAFLDAVEADNSPVGKALAAQRGLYGRNGLMLIAAVRYCLGRSSYIVGDCVDWMLAHWARWPANIREVLQRDIEREFERDDQARERGDQHKPLGMDMDRRQWERARRLWAQCSEPKGRP